jgi:hypothetical protein
MNVLVPCARLLLAAGLMILWPLAAAMLHQSPLWLALPLVVLTATSCVLQSYYRPGVVLACAISNASMLAIVYITGLGVFHLIGAA